MEIEPVNVNGFTALAREALSQPAFAYISGNADGEVTLRESVRPVFALSCARVC